MKTEVKITFFLKVLLLFLVASALIAAAFFWGQNKYVFPVCFFNQGVPVPVSFDRYSGVAQWKGEGQVKITFSPVSAPEKKKEPLLFCIGYVDTGSMVCYLLQSSSGLIVEKATFVEPFLDAVRVSMLDYRQKNAIPLSISPLMRAQIPWQDNRLLQELETWNQEVRTVDTKNYFPW